MQVHIANEAVKVFTRKGHDWTARFKKIALDAWRINAKSAIIDGEVVVPTAEGITDFAALQLALKSRRPFDNLVMYAFDLLYLNGFDMRKTKLVERKDLLRGLIKKTDILFSESFETEGAEFFKHACEIGLEGVVSKKRDSVYRSGRTDNWIKTACRQRETLTIVGYELKESRFDGLYLGRREGDGLLYAGKVDHGFSRDQTVDLLARFKSMVQTTQAYTTKIRKPKAIWLKPTLIAEIEYRAKSALGNCVHPSFKDCARIFSDTYCSVGEVQREANSQGPR